MTPRSTQMRQAAVLARVASPEDKVAVLYVERISTLGRTKASAQEGSTA